MEIFKPTIQDQATFSGSVDISGSLTITQNLNVVGELQGAATTASYISLANVDGFTDVSSSIEQRISRQELFSGSLDSTFATDQELSDVSGALAFSIANISSDFADITNKPTLISSSNQLAGETIDGDLTITGTVTAQEFHTEFVSASIIYQSGSTKFGNSADDTHNFTGNVNISGAVTASKMLVNDGSSNILIGNPAGNNLPAGAASNVLIGDSAGNSSIGDDNIAIGKLVLDNATGEASFRNIFMGPESGRFHYTGNDNIAMGYRSLYIAQGSAPATGSVAIGYSALAGGGTYSVGIGYSSARFANGDYNVILGSFAAEAASDGGQNTLVGAYAGGGTYGSTNAVALNRATAIGYQSQGSAVGDGENTSVGYQALLNVGFAKYNTAIGHQAGDSIVFGGDGNTLIGYGTDVATSTDDNSIVIGSGSLGAGSNTAVLGNDSITKTLLKGNVGIGTTSPASKVHIHTTDASARPLRLGSSGNSYVALDMYTDTIAQQNLYLIAYGSANAQDGSFAIKNNSSHTTTNGTAGDIWFATGASSTERMRIVGSTGNVGIGTDTPGYKLHVGGSTNVSGDILIGGSTVLNSTKRSLFLNSFDAGGGAGIFFRDGFSYNCSITAEDHNGNAADGICISGYDGISFSVGSNSKNEVMRIQGGASGVGNVGIGTTIPKDVLDIKGGGTTAGGGIAFGTKSMSISATFANALTVSLGNHTGVYVKITAFGDWSSHSTIAYVGEFFLQNGAGGYMEPGRIIREDSNIYEFSQDNDNVVAQIVDPGGSTGDRDFIIQLAATRTSGTLTGVPFTAHIQYEVRGQYKSIS